MVRVIRRAFDVRVGERVLALRTERGHGLAGKTERRTRVKKMISFGTGEQRRTETMEPRERRFNYENRRSSVSRAPLRFLITAITTVRRDGGSSGQTGTEGEKNL